MVSSRSVSLALCACLVGTGCTQVLGLGDYSNGSASEETAPDAKAPDASDRDVARDSDAGVMVRPDSSATDAPDARVLPDAAEAANDAPVDVSDSGPTCATTPGYACVALAPAGWTGPLALYEGSGDPLPSVPSCSGPYVTDAFDGFDVPSGASAECACDCAAPVGAECSGTTSFFKDGACKNACGTATTLAPGACTPVSTLGCSLGGEVLSTVASASGGTCAPSALTTVQPWTWTREARACSLAAAPTSLDCGSAAACAPVPTVPYEAGDTCIMRTGTWACPSAFPAQRIYYSSVTDTRACSACTCGEPSGVACSGGTVQSYYDSSCATLAGSASLTPSCDGRSGPVGSLELTGVTATGGTCAPSTVAPTGDVTPEEPTTFCCIE